MNSAAVGGLREALAQQERNLIEDALRQARGNLSRAAARLQIPRTTLLGRMRRLGLPASPRSASLTGANHGQPQPDRYRRPGPAARRTHPGHHRRRPLRGLRYAHLSRPRRSLQRSHGRGPADRAALSGPMLRRDPALCWKYLAGLGKACLAARPNAGHEAIAELQKHKPECWVLTQNIDGFHRQAGSPAERRSRSMANWRRSTASPAVPRAAAWRSICTASCRRAAPLAVGAAAAGGAVRGNVAGRGDRYPVPRIAQRLRCGAGGGNHRELPLYRRTGAARGGREASPRR